MRNEKENYRYVRENTRYILAQKKEKNDSLEGRSEKESGDRGEKRVRKKKKEQEDVGHYTTPPPRGRKTKRKMGFCGL